MANFLKSDEIRVYPSGYRGLNINPESFVNSEENLNSLADRVVKNKSYIVDDSGTKIVFVIKGYLFSAEKSDITDLFGSSGTIYASATVYDVTVTGHSYKTLLPFNSSEAGVLDVTENSESIFKGVYFDTSSGDLALFTYDDGWKVKEESKLIFSTNQIQDNTTKKSITEQFTSEDIIADTVSADTIEAETSVTSPSFIGDLTGNADTATNVTTNIAGKAITSIFESDGTTVQKATHANSSANVDTLTTETANNDTVKFTIGNKTYTKKINDVEHAGYSTNVGNLTNNDTRDNSTIAFSIGDKSYSKSINYVGHAGYSDHASYANPWTYKWGNTVIASSGDGTIMTGDGSDGTSHIDLLKDTFYAVIGITADMKSINFGIVYCFGNRVAYASCYTNDDYYVLEINAPLSGALKGKAYQNGRRIQLTVRFMQLGS